MVNISKIQKNYYHGICGYIYIYIYLFIYTSKTKSFCINLWEYIFMIFIWKRPYFHPNDASDIWVIYSWHVVIYMYDLLLHNIVIVLMYLHYISDMYIIYVTITVIYQNTVHICVCVIAISAQQLLRHQAVLLAPASGSYCIASHVGRTSGGGGA